MARLTTVERVDIIVFFAKYESLSTVQRVFAEKYGKVPPQRETISNLVKKFKATGSVMDASRKGKDH